MEIAMFAAVLTKILRNEARIKTMMMMYEVLRFYIRCYQ